MEMTPEEKADYERIAELARNLPDPDSIRMEDLTMDEKMDLMLAESLAETWKKSDKQETP
jgi:hypothetical protein